jgi:hypothetical protein
MPESFWTLEKSRFLPSPSLVKMSYETLFLHFLMLRVVDTFKLCGRVTCTFQAALFSVAHSGERTTAERKD